MIQTVRTHKPFIENGLLVLKDKTGRTVAHYVRFPYVYYSEGLAMVQDADTLLYGFVNREGKLVIPCQYREVSDFWIDWAMVSDDSGKWGAIDCHNNLVEPIEYDWEELRYKLYDFISGTLNS